MKRWGLVVLCWCLFACQQEPSPSSGLSGYIEGDYRFVATPQSGWLQVVSPLEGSVLALGDVVNALDDAQQRLALQYARQAQQQAEADYRNLQTGKRDVELDALRAQKQALFSEWQQASSDAERHRRLAASNASPKRQAEAAMTRVHTLQAQMEAVAAQIAAAGLPAREAKIAAARARVEMAATQVAQAQHALQERQIVSLFDGEVVAVYARQGEFVRSGQVLLKVLPKAARKVIFYVPQARLPEFALGQRVVVTADNQAAQIAVISHIGDEVEFAPPILYSERHRDKLVFRLQARFQGAGFAPGLPVSIAHE